MISRSRAVLVLSGLALVLPACVEADVQAEMKADGSGSLGMGMKFSDKFVEIVRKMEKIDPKQDIVKQARSGLFQKPDEALLAAWEKAGLKLVRFEAVSDEKRLSSTVKVDFRSLESLRKLEEFQGKDNSPAGGFTLTRDEKGVYTLAMGSPQKEGAGGEAIEIEDGDGEDGDEGGMEGGAKPAGKEGGKEEPAADADAEAKKAGEAMAMLGELMGEVQNFKFSLSMKVPGEVVDFAPAAAATKDGSTVSWKFDFASMMQAQMGGEGQGMDTFKVRFCLPEGQSIPESALTTSAPARAPAAPSAPPAPPAPPAPAGGK